MISGTDKDIRKIEKMMRNQTIVYAIVYNFWVACVQECYISEIEYACQSLPNVKVKNAKTGLEIDVGLFELFESRKEAEQERQKAQAMIDAEIPMAQRNEMAKAFVQMRGIL